MLKSKRLTITLILMLSFLSASMFSYADTVQPMDPSRPPIEIDTLTPSFITEFRDDYVSFETQRLLKWLTPKRGLVEDGVLMTYERTREKMSGVEQEMRALKPRMAFLRGYYNGFADLRQFYKAFYQISIPAGKSEQKINMIAVFERIDGKWYLVQTHSLKLHRDTSMATPEDILALQSNILAIGDYPFDYSASTYSLTQPPRRFSSEISKNRNRPVLLNFFARFSGDFNAQMEWAESFYPKLRGKNIYFFCVSDTSLEFLQPYLKDSGFQIIAHNNVVLLDEDSKMHHILEIDIHPYLMLIDHRGVVRAISRGYNRESLGLIEEITFSIIDEANRDIRLEKESGRSSR